MKRILKLLLILPVLIILALVAVFLFIDNLAKRGVENGATRALGVETRLDSADVGVLTGTFSMAGLHVANPPGFSSPTFLKLDEGDVALNISSLMGDTVELPTLTLKGIELNVIRKGLDANYKVIIENLKKFEGDPTKEGGKQFVIRKIEIRDVMVHAEVVPLGGEATKAHVPIDLITLTDVGAGSAGYNMAELANTLVKAILKATIENGGGLIPSDIAGEISGGLASLDDIGGMLGGSIGEAIGEIGAGAGDAGKEADKALKGLGGLLGGDKDKK